MGFFSSAFHIPYLPFFRGILKVLVMKKMVMVLELIKWAWDEDRQELGVVEAWWVVVEVVSFK